MTDNIKPLTPQWYARQRRHRHNSYHGGVAMAKAYMRAIGESDTTTPKAKELAWKIHDLVTSLGVELRTRIDR